MNYAAIYQFTNKVNGKIYIGQTIDPDRRFKEHIHKSHNVDLSKDIDIFGLENFEFKIVEFIRIDNMTEIFSLLDKREQYYLNIILKANEDNDFFDRIAYNKTRNVSLLGYTHTEESNSLLSETKRGVKLSKEHRQSMSNCVKRDYINGKRASVFSKLTEEQRRKICEKAARKTSIRVAQYTLSGIYINEFISQTSAAKYLGLKKSYNINKCLKGVVKTAYGYQWRYITDDNYKKSIKNLSRKIKVLDYNKNLIDVNSIQEICAKFNISMSRMNLILNNSKYNYSKGYYFYEIPKNE